MSSTLMIAAIGFWQEICQESFVRFDHDEMERTP
jgi:hypothetical protein